MKCVSTVPIRKFLLYNTHNIHIQKDMYIHIHKYLIRFEVFNINKNLDTPSLKTFCLLMSWQI